jgi:membrane dipeptidase
LIDGHVDFPIAIRGYFGNHINSANFSEAFETGGLPGHVDLLRLRQGLTGGAFWSVFAPCPEDGDDFSDENYAACTLQLNTSLGLT